MRFNVAQLLKSPAGATREYELNDDIAGIDDSLEIIKPLTGRVRLLRTGTGILVTGKLHTEASLTCCRCLNPALVPIEWDLEEEFRPSIDLVTGTVVKVQPGDDAATRTDARHILDLTEVVRQSILLAVPLSPVCNLACHGICPECGANLNDGPCNCSHASGDPRLEALRELL